MELHLKSQTLAPCAHWVQFRSTIAAGPPGPQLMRSLEPDGCGLCVFDAVGGANIGLMHRCVTKGRGMVVGFGFMGAPGILCPRVAMFCKSIYWYATARQAWGFLWHYRLFTEKTAEPFHEDLPKDIYAAIAEKKIDPLVTHTFGLFEARQAIELLLAKGSVEGKIVLMSR
jgi:NADPH:quinone reductase-like Zn-dependent oxidoreductase